MERFIKILFIAAPALIMAFGVFLLIRAAQFWLVIISPSEVSGYPLVWAADSPIEATVYLPNVIRSKDSPIKIDVDIIRKTGEDPLNVGVQMVSECDYISFEKSFGEVKFDSQMPTRQTYTGQMKVRNMTPPTSCEVIVQSSTPDGLGFIAKTIPVDAITGNAIAVIQLILGFAGTFLGFRGLQGFVSQQ